MLSEEKCPWKIEFDEVPVYYYGRREPNIWNRAGNGWREDRSVSIECHDPDKDPVYDCGCQSLNVSSAGIVGEKHGDKLGECLTCEIFIYAMYMRFQLHTL